MHIVWHTAGVVSTPLCMSATWSSWPMLFSDLLPIPCMFVDYKWVRCSSSAGRVQQNTDNAFSFLGQRPSLCQYPSSIFAIPPAAQHILPINATALISRSRPFLCFFYFQGAKLISDIRYTIFVNVAQIRVRNRWAVPYWFYLEQLRVEFLRWAKFVMRFVGFNS